MQEIVSLTQKKGLCTVLGKIYFPMLEWELLPIKENDGNEHFENGYIRGADYDYPLNYAQFRGKRLQTKSAIA